MDNPKSWFNARQGQDISLSRMRLGRLCAPTIHKSHRCWGIFPGGVAMTTHLHLGRRLGFLPYTKNNKQADEGMKTVRARGKFTSVENSVMTTQQTNADDVHSGGGDPVFK